MIKSYTNAHWLSRDVRFGIRRFSACDVLDGRQGLGDGRGLGRGQRSHRAGGLVSAMSCPRSAATRMFGQPPLHTGSLIATGDEPACGGAFADERRVWLATKAAHNTTRDEGAVPTLRGYGS